MGERHAVAKLVEALCCQPHYDPGVDSASNTMSIRNVLGGKGRPARKADNLTAIYADFLEHVGASTSHNPMGLHVLLQGWLLTVSRAVSENQLSVLDITP
jgi:hypothetical protein